MSLRMFKNRFEVSPRQACSSRKSLSRIALTAALLICTPVFTFAYAIGSTTIPYISINSGSFNSGNCGSGQLVLNGVANVTSDGQLQVASDASGASFQSASAWCSMQVPVTQFTTEFQFQILDSDGESMQADGLTFTLQAAGTNARGGVGDGLGYAGIPKSVAIKFDAYDNWREAPNHCSEGSDSTGVFLNGATPLGPFNAGCTALYDMTSHGVLLLSGRVLDATLTYDGTLLTLQLRDTVSKATYVQSFPVDIPTTLGGDLGYVGFTGAVGKYDATVNILNWSYTSVPTTAPPTISPASGSFNSTQTAYLSDATTGAKIYYTTDGTVPTTSSNLYDDTTGVPINTSLTLKAIASVTGYASSPVVSAKYKLITPAPTFSVKGGTYASAQAVTITDTNSNATIYFTTDGSTPSTSNYAANFASGGTVNIGSDIVLKAIAVVPGFQNSAVTSATYNVRTAAPTFSPAGGSSGSSPYGVTITATTGSTIYYTTDGTTPTTSSSSVPGSGGTAWLINHTSKTKVFTVKAIAVQTNYANSAVSTATYTVTPSRP